MSAITLDGKLYMTFQERAFKAKDVVRFLKHLMRQIPLKLLVVWDGSAIHRGGQALKDFLARGGQPLECNSNSCPSLRCGSQGPDEGICKHLKSAWS
jgi:hypothetical protein